MDYREILQQVLEYLIPILLPVAIVAVAHLARAASRRLGIDASDKEIDLVRSLCVDAVSFVEQRAGVAKAKGTEPLMSSSDKKQLARAFVVRVAQAKGLSPIAVEMVDSLIESALSRARPEFGGRAARLPAIALALLMPLIFLSGCVSGEVQRTAAKARTHAAVVREASRPAKADPDYADAYGRAWDELEAALRDIEEAAK